MLVQRLSRIVTVILLSTVLLTIGVRVRSTPLNSDWHDQFDYSFANVPPLCEPAPFWSTPALPLRLPANVTLAGPVRGVSMLPSISTGQYVLSVPATIENVSVCSTIIFQDPTTHDVILHRVVGTATDAHGWYAWTRGDNVQYSDGLRLRLNQILGRVIMELK